MPNNKWRLIVSPPLPPQMNMAIDEAIALTYPKIQIPTLRLYSWACPALSIGSFQEITADLSSCLKDNKIQLVRRITGGRAILHDREITYSVVASTRDPLFSGGIKQTFYSIAQALISGLSQLGIEAYVHVPKKEGSFSRPQSPFCIESFSWYELVASEKKLIGSAQKRWVNHFLQHGSLVFTPSLFEETLHLDKTLHLSDLLPYVPTLSKIQNSIQAGFESALSSKLEEQPLTNEESQIANQLANEKYGNSEWNNYRKKSIIEGNSSLSDLVEWPLVL
jgi:lipoate-protein ligase A